MRIALILALAGLAPAGAFGAEAPAKNWGDQAEFSLVTTNGNSKATTLSAQNAFGWTFLPGWRLDTAFGGLGSKSQETTTAEQYFAWEKVAYKLDERNYAFEKYRWDRDRFAKIAHRHEISAGLGREVWKTQKDLLIAEAAPTYVNEEHIGSPRDVFAAGRFYAKYARQLNSTAKFSQDAEYLQSLELAKDNRLVTETAVTAALSALFSIKAGYVWKHDSLPPAGARKDDTVTNIALIASF
ncbi:MAG: DUF481 domain-containing protein [Elusimicrobia bacterium]|nr:DUF481 domain-containing protein [Elusimicrobiota bacterium]